MFSLSWFTTPAGICITVGVLLLIIALVLFIVTSKKDKKNKTASANGVNSVPNNVNTSQPVVQNGVSTAGFTPVQNGVGQPVVATEQPVINVGMDGIQNPNMPLTQQGMPEATVLPNNMGVNNNGFNDVNSNLGVMPVNNVPVNMPSDVLNEPQVVQVTDVPAPEISTITENVNQGGAGDVVEAVPSIPVVSNEPSLDMNNNYQSTAIPAIEPVPQIESTTVNNTASSMDSVTIPSIAVADMNSGVNINEVTTPSVDQVIPELQGADGMNNGISAVEPTPVVNNLVQPEISSPTVPIYGGSDPIVPNITVPSEEHQIYGGANPLENTQSVSINDIASGINSSQGYTAPVSSSVPMESMNTSAVVTEPINDQVSAVSSVTASSVSEITPTVTPSVSPAVVNPAISSVPVNNTLQQSAPVVNEPTVNSINNNFAYQSSAAPQVQIPVPTDVSIQ